MPHTNDHTFAEHTDRAQKWATFLTTQSDLPPEQQNIPEELDEWEQVWVTATCHTEGCPAQGRSDEILLYLNAGGAQAMCGPCGYPPTLIGHFTDGPREIPNTYPNPDDTPDPGPGDSDGDDNQGG